MEENKSLKEQNAELLKKDAINTKGLYSYKAEIYELRKRKMLDTQGMTKLTEEV